MNTGDKSYKSVFLFLFYRTEQARRYHITMNKVPKDTSKEAAGPLVEESRITGQGLSPHKEVANTKTRIDPFASRPGHVLKWTNVNVKVARKGKDDI
jgi:hypothetical protein